MRCHPAFDSPTSPSRSALTGHTPAPHLPRWSASAARLALCAGFALLAWPTPSVAQDFDLGVKLDFTTGTTPYSVAIGDLNGDRRPDLVVANSGSYTVSVLLGNGSGGFGAKTDFMAGGYPICVALGDLNGDGRLDLVAANYGSYTVSVLLGDGAGGFGPKTDFATGEFPFSVAIGDLNGDGKPDLAVANYFSNTVSVLLGDGAGGFGTKTDFVTGNLPCSVAIGNLDSDGRADLAVANSGSNTVSVLLGDGAGGFGPRTDFATGTAPQSVAIGDVSSDRKADLATANYGSHTASVLLGNGLGSFGARTDFATGTGPYSVAIGDATGDGRADLVTANYFANTVSVMWGSGGGSFGAKVDFAVGTNPTSVAIGDVSGDGKPDIAAANAGVHTVSVLLGNTGPLGTGGFAARTDFVAGTTPLSVAIGDLNADAKLDMVVANSGSNTVSVLLGNGTGGFGAKSDLATGTSPYSVAIGDVNSDGRPDLAVANRSSNTVSVILGNGDGTFGAKTDWPTLTNPNSVRIGNARGYGQADLVVAEFGVAMVSVIPGNGTGTFGTRADYPAGTGPTCAAIGDLNADLRPDLVVTNNYSNTVSVLLGNGSGGFGSKTDFATGTYPRAVAIGDLNGDNRLDVVTANYSSSVGAVSVLLGDGAGGLGARTDHDAGGPGASVAIGDLNGDGKPDLALANANNVSVLLGDGAGGFGARTDFTTGGSPTGMATGDLNGDGRPDLAVSNYTSNAATVLLALKTTAISLASSPDPSLSGVAVTLAATVSVAEPWNGTPTGSVRFFDGTTLLGTATLSGGVATLAVSSLGLGNRPLSAVYLGDTRFLGRFSTPVTQRVAASFGPVISRVRDVGSDQGRQVRLYVTPSPADYAGAPQPVVRYSVFRRIDDSVAPAARAQAAASRTRYAAGEPASDPTAIQIAGWDAVGSMDASADTIYSIVVPTLSDSNGTGTHWAAFFVRASTATPSVYYDSAPDSGYSLDNLPPAPPAPFTAAYESGATHLHWGASTEADLGYYRIHRGDSEDFTPGPGNLVATRSDTGYVDPGPAGGYYKLSAVDVNGNESAFTLLTPGGTLEVTGGTPLDFALEGVRPNPSRGGRMSVTFTLTSGAPARLDVLDVSGRRVVAREVGALGAGRHVVDLAAERALPPGLYLAQLTRGADVRVVRVVVLR